MEEITAALDQVDPRLRRVREQRGITLTDVANRTGLSKSILSRLENGRRRPSLEPLLPLAQTYRVLLDDLVGVGEAVEFDTRMPHSFGSTGEGPAQVLSSFGRPDERMHVRAPGAADGA